MEIGLSPKLPTENGADGFLLCTSGREGQTNPCGFKVGFGVIGDVIVKKKLDGQMSLVSPFVHWYVSEDKLDGKPGRLSSGSKWICYWDVPQILLSVPRYSNVDGRCNVLIRLIRLKLSAYSEPLLGG